MTTTDLTQCADRRGGTTSAFGRKARVRAVVVLGAVLFGDGLASDVVGAAGGLQACRLDKSKLQLEIRAAFQTAFPQTASRGDERPCAYPWGLLDYKSSEMLLTLDGPSAVSCEACESSVFATALSRNPKLAIAGQTFFVAKLGQQGRPGAAKALTVSGDDGVAFETRYGQQGYNSTLLELYMFRNGKAVSLSGPAKLILSADNTGAQDKNQIVVRGTWSIDNTEAPVLRIVYAIAAHGRTVRSGAIWRIDGNRLVALSGGVPKEAVIASGN
jgi:hypothetical protein